MTELKITEIESWLKEYDRRDNMHSPKAVNDPKFIELKEKLRSGAIKLGESMHCVVGIDILAGS